MRRGVDDVIPNCVDCKFCAQSANKVYECSRDYPFLEKDVVTGEPNFDPARPCAIARLSLPGQDMFEQCGVEGRFFEPNNA